VTLSLTSPSAAPLTQAFPPPPWGLQSVIESGSFKQSQEEYMQLLTAAREQLLEPRCAAAGPGRSGPAPLRLAGAPPNSQRTRH
jgi:hypothetical protein